MTREEIEKAWRYYQGFSFIEFALQMVRQHNEEVAKIAEKHWHPTLGLVANQIAEAIRAAAPK